MWILAKYSPFNSRRLHFWLCPLQPSSIRATTHRPSFLNIAKIAMARNPLAVSSSIVLPSQKA